jgi:hypothetical protein
VVCFPFLWEEVEVEISEEVSVHCFLVPDEDRHDALCRWLFPLAVLVCPWAVFSLLLDLLDGRAEYCFKCFK